MASAPTKMSVLWSMEVETWLSPDMRPGRGVERPKTQLYWAVMPGWCQSCCL
jgi:hypothetical protein